MRILICVTYLTGGGAERVASLWAKGFVNEGHEVAICLNTDSATISYPVPDVVSIFNVYKKDTRLLRELGIGVGLRLRKILRSYKPDVIIGVLPSWCKIIWMAKLGLNIPFIDTEHNAFERPKEAPMHWREKLDKFVFSRLADGMTVLTESDYKIIGKKRKNVFVLPNPLSFEPTICVPPKKNVILACGRLDVWYTKGFDLLIKAWGDVANSHNDWKLIIAGDGNKESYQFLNTIAAESHLSKEQFELIGRCENIQLLYKISSIFVLSSRFEGFGMVLTEAMSQGCACIACDYKGRQAEIIANNEQGIVISNIDSNAISYNLNYLINNKQQRTVFQENAIERSKDFSIVNVMKKWNSILTKVL